MNDDRSLERAARSWLEEGPTQAPDRAVEAALLHIETTSQERDLRVSWRVSRMSTMTRIAALSMSTFGRMAVAAVVAAVALGGVLYLAGPGQNVGAPGPSPSLPPTPVPSPSLPPTPVPTPIDTSTWSIYTSSQYGFSIGHPEDWNVAPATRAWTVEDDGTNFLTSAADAVVAPGQLVRVSAWAIPFDSGVTLETSEEIMAWVEDYCPKTDIVPCSAIHDRAEPLCVEKRDCHPGLLVSFATEVQAFFTGGIYPADQMTVVTVWRPEAHATTQPDGGSKALLLAFLSTMDVWPAP